MPLNVVDLSPTNPVVLMEQWLTYCADRGLTNEILAPLKGELLSLDRAAKIMGTGIFGMKNDGAIGAYVFQIAKDEFQARVLYGPEPEIGRPGQTVKPKKRLKYFRPKNSVNVLFVPPHLTDWRTPATRYNLLIVEGALNATRLAAQGYHAVGITGVHNYRLGNKHTPIIPELISLVQSEQADAVTVLLDSDAEDQEGKRELWVGRNMLCQELMKLRPKRRDTVLLCSPPSLPNGMKQGPDDFLHASGLDEFNKLLSEQSLKYEDNDYLRLERAAIERYIFEQDSGLIFDTHSRSSVRSSHVDLSLAIYGPVDDITANRPTRILYHHKKMLSAPGMRSAWGKRYQPDQDAIYFQDEEEEPPRYFINTFQPEDVPKAIKGDVSIAYKMMESICRNTPSAVQKLLTIAAKHAQFPALLPKYGVLMTGQQGSGKSTLARLIGLALSKRYNSDKVNLGIDFNKEWRGFACKEWPEFDKDMNEEWLKDLITGDSYLVSVKYGTNYREKNHTLNIFTCNGLQAKIQEGDRRFLVCGDAKADNKKLGLEFEAWVNGMGPNHFRYHLLNDIDCSTYDLLDVWTEMKDAVIEASKSVKSTVKDMVLEDLRMIPGLTCIANIMLEKVLEDTGYKYGIISFMKEFRQTFIKPKKEVIKINGHPYRFSAFDDHDRWRKEENTDEYRKQYDLAERYLMKGEKYDK